MIREIVLHLRQLGEEFLENESREQMNWWQIDQFILKNWWMHMSWKVFWATFRPPFMYHAWTLQKALRVLEFLCQWFLAHVTWVFCIVSLFLHQTDDLQGWILNHHSKLGSPKASINPLHASRKGRVMAMPSTSFEDSKFKFSRQII